MVAEKLMKRITFSPEMVRAILGGRKFQTRRLIKAKRLLYVNGWRSETGEEIEIRYKPGDIVYVCEPFQYEIIDGKKTGRFLYKADGVELPKNTLYSKWRSARFMPKNASRIFLEIQSIKIERWMDISREDALEEGVEKEGKFYRNYLTGRYDLGTPQQSFITLFRSLNKDIEYKYVFCLKFKIYELLKG